ncbi:MAG: hypothetical protein K2J95_13755 [Lachnospiraceae bacterium]|nr:hypothetical protein [Lachnospiraceae bacterium]
MENMEGNSYEEYKKNLSSSRKKREKIHDGKVGIVAGIFLLLFVLFILPFHAENAHLIHGDQIEAGGFYDPQKVYYFEDLQILHAKTDTDDGSIYCIARFIDCDQKDWIISFTPGRDEHLSEQIRLFASFQKEEHDLTVSGYFLMRYLEELPFEADSYFSVYGRNYAADGSNMISINAEYLCDKYDNYTLQALFRPGTPLCGFVVGLVGIIVGVISLIRYRTRKTV